jgi:hypothetical protein
MDIPRAVRYDLRPRGGCQMVADALIPPKGLCIQGEDQQRKTQQAGQKHAGKI